MVYTILKLLVQQPPIVIFFLLLTVTMKVLVLCALVAGAMSALVEFRDKDIFEPLSDEMIWFINKMNTTWKVIMKTLFII